MAKSFVTVNETREWDPNAALIKSIVKNKQGQMPAKQNVKGKAKKQSTKQVRVRANRKQSKTRETVQTENHKKQR